jgi:hypothetical protein
MLRNIKNFVEEANDVYKDIKKSNSKFEIYL